MAMFRWYVNVYMDTLVAFGSGAALIQHMGLFAMTDAQIKGDMAVVSHEAGTAVVTLSSDIDDAVLKQTVEAQDYTVKEIE